MPAKCYSLHDMPIKIIAIANQKGGTAKTTTTAAIAVLLSRGGVSVHMVDMDPQASLTRAFGLADSTDRLYNALSDRAGLPIDAVAESLTLTPSTVETLSRQTELLTRSLARNTSCRNLPGEIATARQHVGASRLSAVSGRPGGELPGCGGWAADGRPARRLSNCMRWSTCT